MVLMVFMVWEIFLFESMGNIDMYESKRLKQTKTNLYTSINSTAENNFNG